MQYQLAPTLLDFLELQFWHQGRVADMWFLNITLYLSVHVSSLES